MIEADRPVSAGTIQAEDVVDRAIRPKLLDEYIGQPQVRPRWRSSSVRQSCAAMRSITC